MKIKSLILILIIFLVNILSAEATQLPTGIKDYLVSQKKVPQIRFDGIVVYSDDVMYIPVFPAYPEEVEKISIKQTYPKDQQMAQLPDMVLFNNNFALLKIVRVGQNTLTVRTIPDLPVEIKTGLLPQDIMVPRGLVFPENLAGILGDVQVPLVGSAKSSTFVSTRKTAPLPSGKRVADTKRYNVPSDLKDKLFFVNNFQTEYLQVFSSTVSEPLYSLKTSGVMKDVKPVLNGNFLLIATRNKKNIDVVDITNEYVAKHIDLTSFPTEIAVDDANMKAYIASTDDESLSVIDLESMSMKEKIQLVGSPQCLSLSGDGTKLAYVDMKTSSVYVLDLQNNYENKLITSFPNATKILLKDNIIYAIARTKPKLRVIYFDLFQDNKLTKSKKQKKQEEEQKISEQKEAEDVTNDLIYEEDFAMEAPVEELVENAKTYSTSIKDIEVGAKPVDMYMKNGKIYVLCAGNNSVYVYDTTKGDIKEQKLSVEGFSKAFTPVPGSNLAIITNMADLKYVVYDMEKEKELQSYPVSEYINMITILERKNER